MPQVPVAVRCVGELGNRVGLDGRNQVPPQEGVEVTTPAPRDVKSIDVDGQSTTFLSPAEQAQEDRRQAERAGLKKTRSPKDFFRMFRITSADRP